MTVARCGTIRLDPDGRPDACPQPGGTPAAQGSSSARCAVRMRGRRGDQSRHLEPCGGGALGKSSPKYLTDCCSRGILRYFSSVFWGDHLRRCASVRCERHCTLFAVTSPASRLASSRACSMETPGCLNSNAEPPRANPQYSRSDAVSRAEKPIGPCRAEVLPRSPVPARTSLSFFLSDLRSRATGHRLSQDRPREAADCCAARKMGASKAFSVNRADFRMHPVPLIGYFRAPMTGRIAI